MAFLDMRNGYKGRDRNALLEDEVTSRPVAVAVHSAAAIAIIALLIDFFLAFIRWKVPVFFVDPGWFFRLFLASAGVILAVFLIDRKKRA